MKYLLFGEVCCAENLTLKAVHDKLTNFFVLNFLTYATDSAEKERLLIILGSIHLIYKFEFFIRTSEKGEQ